MAYELDPRQPAYVPIPGVRQPIGLGDVIARMTSAVGIKPCDACKRRQQWLNEHIMLGRRR